MVDLESMGKGSNSAICSLAAVEFDLKTGATGRSFYEIISIQSCLDAGLKVDGSTIEWWLQQSESARMELTSGKAKSLQEVLFYFSVFCNALGIDTLQVWGNGARFDLGLMHDAFRTVGNVVPWKFWNERDVRTLVSFAPEVKKNTPFDGTAHNALADCYHQIKYCSEIAKIKNL